VGEFNQPFDVALATHLCGDATDVAMERSVRCGAAFIATPCCLGKVARSALIADSNSEETAVECVSLNVSRRSPALQTFSAMHIVLLTCAGETGTRDPSGFEQSYRGRTTSS
jgi:hypothetical protein